LAQARAHQTRQARITLFSAGRHWQIKTRRASKMPSSGVSSGIENTTGSHNSFFGNRAGISNTTAGDNSFFGFATGTSNTTGTLNSFFGSSSGAGKHNRQLQLLLRLLVQEHQTLLGSTMPSSVKARAKATRPARTIHFWETTPVSTIRRQAASPS